jgi:hypothetical protein
MRAKRLPGLVHLGGDLLSGNGHTDRVEVNGTVRLSQSHDRDIPIDAKEFGLCRSRTECRIGQMTVQSFCRVARLSGKRR